MVLEDFLEDVVVYIIKVYVLLFISLDVLDIYGWVKV